MLVERGNLLSKQRDVASAFSKLFGSITDSLNHFSWSENTPISSGNDKENSIIKKCAFQPSIKAIINIEMLK